MRLAKTVNGMMNLLGHVVMVIANIVPILSTVGVFTNHVWKGAIRLMRGVHTIDKQKFYEAYEKYITGQLNISDSAKLVGVSKPTLRKYFGILLTNGEFPDTLFTKSDK